MSGVAFLFLFAEFKEIFVAKNCEVMFLNFDVFNIAHCVANLDVCVFKCHVVVADEVAIIEDVVICKVRIDDDAVLV